jgi:Tol biopolymer transport system component
LLLAGCAGAGVGRFPLLADPGGCVLEQITDAGSDDGHFQFHGPSPDGGKMVVGWYRGTEAGAYLVDLRSGGRRPLPGINNAGVFSPDGRRVLIANRQPDGNRELVELDLASGRSRVVAPDPAADFLATYAPTGGTILFNSYRSGRSDIYALDRDTDQPERLTTFEGYDAHADWSPDRHAIVFHREVTKNDYDVYVLDLVSRRERPLVVGPGEQAYPAWSPDGRWIVFVSDAESEPGKGDLYLTDPTGTHSVRLTLHPGYNTYPAWSSDSRSIYFNSEREGKRNVFRLRLLSTKRSQETPAGCRGRAPMPDARTSAGAPRR